MAGLTKIAGQAIPMLAGLGNDFFNQIGSMTALFMNQQRLDQALGLNDSLLNGQIQGGINLPFIGNLFGQQDPSTSIPGQLQAFTDKYSPLAQQNYDNTLTNLSNMRNMGFDTFSQLRRDTNTSFDAQGKANLADAAARGLSSSSIPYSMANNLQRNRSDAMAGIADRELAQRQNFEGYALNAGNAAFQNNLQTQYNLLTNPLQSLMDLTNQKIGILQGVTDAYPDQSLRAQIASGIGSGMAPPASMPSTSGLFGSSAVGGLSSGLGLGGGLALANLFGGGGGAAALPTTMFMTPCVDGEAILQTNDGPKMFKDVVEGDYVLNAKRQYAKIIFKDYGPAPSVKSGTFVRVTMRGGHSLIITEGHHVGGRPVSQIRVGEQFGFKKHILESKELVEPRPCGDLLLEGGGGYVVNGIAVDSMLEYMGADKMQLTKAVKSNAVR